MIVNGGEDGFRNYYFVYFFLFLGEKVFGEEIQSGEHEIEGVLTMKMNQWNLGNEYCHYIELI